jgi:hypothetical protein
MRVGLGWCLGTVDAQSRTQIDRRRAQTWARVRVACSFPSIPTSTRPPQVLTPLAGGDIWRAGYGKARLSLVRNIRRCRHCLFCLQPEPLEELCETSSVVVVLASSDAASMI